MEIFLDKAYESFQSLLLVTCVLGAAHSLQPGALPLRGIWGG